MDLLTFANTKILKGSKKGYATFGIHLAPHTSSGSGNVCPKATKACIEACLNYSGRGKCQMVQNGRVRKTKLFFDNRAGFLAILVNDIEAAIRKANRENMVPCFRLNLTSDLSWEKYSVIRNGNKFINIFAAFPEVQFYDYTAVPNRKVFGIPNYHLTFSAKEDNAADVKKALNSGMNVSVVFDTIPETYLGFKVISGDDTDLRFLDPKNVIVGLTFKGGKAKKEKAISNGFVFKGV